MERRTDFIDELREFNSQFREPPAPKEYDWDRVHRFDDAEPEIGQEFDPEFLNPRIRRQDETEEDREEREEDFIEFVSRVPEIKTWVADSARVWKSAVEGMMSPEGDYLADSLERHQSSITRRIGWLKHISACRKCGTDSAIELSMFVAETVVERSRQISQGMDEPYRSRTIEFIEVNFGKLLKEPSLVENAIKVEKSRLLDILHGSSKNPPITIAKQVRENIKTLLPALKFEQKKFCELLLATPDTDYPKIKLADLAMQLGWPGREEIDWNGRWSGLRRRMQLKIGEKAWLYQHGNYVLAGPISERDARSKKKKNSKKNKKRSKSAVKKP